MNAGAARVKSLLNLEAIKSTEVQPLPDGKFRCIVIDPPWPVQKIRRLRLEVVVPVCRKKTTTTIKLPAELPSVEDENRLKQMLQADKSVRVIAKAMGKTRDCIRKKIARLGLEVVDEEKKRFDYYFFGYA